MIGTLAVSGVRRRRRQTSSPDIPSIIQSSRMMSGGDSVANSKASSPSGVCSTLKSSRSKCHFSRSVSAGSSSTSKRRPFIMPAGLAAKRDTFVTVPDLSRTSGARRCARAAAARRPEPIRRYSDSPSWTRRSSANQRVRSCGWSWTSSGTARPRIASSRQNSIWLAQPPAGRAAITPRACSRLSWPGASIASSGA